MQNSCVVSSDTNGVYLSIRPEVSWIKKLLLVASNVAFTGFLSSVLFYLEPREIGVAFILLVIFLSFLSLQLMRFTLWNFLGKEILIVNRRSITTQLDYGLFILSPVSIPCNEWMVTYEKTGATTQGELGKILVHNYLKDGLAMNIHETASELPSGAAENFLSELQRMIDDENRRFPVKIENLQFPRMMDN